MRTSRWTADGSLSGHPCQLNSFLMCNWPKSSCINLHCSNKIKFFISKKKSSKNFEQNQYCKSKWSYAIHKVETDTEHYPSWNNFINTFDHRKIRRCRCNCCSSRNVVDGAPRCVTFVSCSSQSELLTWKKFILSQEFKFSRSYIWIEVYNRPFK